MSNAPVAATESDAKKLAVLEELNQGYIRAVEHSDVDWFERHLEAEFLNSNPDGSLVDRAGFLAQIARPSTATGIETQDVRIRLLDDFAFIHARTVYRKADGQSGAGRYTDIWRLTEGGWRCVCAHVTRA